MQAKDRISRLPEPARKKPSTDLIHVAKPDASTLQRPCSRKPSEFNESRGDSLNADLRPSSVACHAWGPLRFARMRAELSDYVARHGNPARRFATDSKIVIDF